MALDPRKFMARFIEEAKEHCNSITDGLLALEKNPGDTETIHALFRSAHTIKGSARMLKQMGVSGLAHHMEDVLDAVRGGRLGMTPAISDVLLKGVDALTAMLDTLAQGGEAKDAPPALCQELTALIAGEQAATPPQPQAGPSPSTQSEPIVAPAEEAPAGPTASETAGRTTAAPKVQTEYLRIDAAKLDDMIHLMGEIVSEHSRLRQQIRHLRDADRSAHRFVKTLDTWFHRHGVDEAAQRELRGALRDLQHSLRDPIRAIHDSTNLQEHLVGDLREASLKMRMLPLSTIFDPLRRTVRDLAREFGKDVDFIVEGGETELDRKIIERLGDPLIHMIRNALDHALESPEERAAAGKPTRGVIALSASYEGGFVTLSIRDDGRGLSPTRIKEKAVAKRLYDAETLAAMSRSEVNNIIFLPGFSTSPIITDLSGRGVGMDVVRKNVVDGLKGAITIDSKEGEGTAFHLRLPLNLAVFPLFMIRTGDKVCALPATSIQEMLSLPRKELVEVVGKHAIRLREQLVPVEDLASLLGLPPHAEGKGDLVIVILGDGDERLGLIVQEIISREEMVVKPLPVPMQNVRVASGATLGEGDKIINVLQVPELFRLAKEAGRAAHRPSAETVAQAIRILVVDDSFNTREIERSILEAHGYQVITAGDGEEAFEKTRTERYDVVITDVEMPRMDGFTLTQRLREDERYHSTPIIIVTSLEKDEDKRRGIAVGADAYIVKSAFDQSNLLDTVRGLIG